MFTGLVQTLGTVEKIEQNSTGRRLHITQPSLVPSTNIGDSIAVNGVCLTVVDREEQTMCFQAVSETLRCTNLGELQRTDRVNLESALCAGDPLGGHLVQGHIDGVGQLAEREPQGDGQMLRFTCPPVLVAQMVSKGSVAVDGVSLTVVDVTDDGFRVALIPHTLAVTTLGFRRVGDTVNLETDVLAKYVWKYLKTLDIRM